MTLLNFPSDPASVDNIYLGPNGVTYIFDGVKWIGQSAGGGGISTELVNGSHHLTMNPDGSMRFPYFTIPASDGTSGQILETNGSGVLSWVSASLNSGNYTFSGDDLQMPLIAKLNSGGVGTTNSAEFGTEVTKSGATVTHSEIYMGGGTAEARAITDSAGRSLMYLGVENVGEGKFAGIVASDPNLDPSQYTIALNGDGLPILGDSTITYATAVGVMNSDFTINGLYVDETQTVVATGVHAWFFDRNGDVTVPGQIKDVQGNRAIWSNEVPRDISDLTDNGMLLGMSSSTIDINIDGGGASAAYEGTLIRADGGFSSTRWGINTVIYDGGVGAGGGTYSETLNGGGA